MVDSHQMQHGCVKIMYVHPFFDRLKSKLIGRPVHHSPVHAASGQPLPEPWVDQARGIARELLRYGLRKNEAVPWELLDRIDSDPALFWLRGEAQPPGVWRPEGIAPC